MGADPDAAMAGNAAMPALMPPSALMNPRREAALGESGILLSFIVLFYEWFGLILRNTDQIASSCRLMASIWSSIEVTSANWLRQRSRLWPSR